jgi:hypothetical protein
LYSSAARAAVAKVAALNEVLDGSRNSSRNSRSASVKKKKLQSQQNVCAAQILPPSLAAAIRRLQPNDARSHVATGEKADADGCVQADV